MSAVTIPSIAYVATQLRFALCSASVFSRTDTVTDTERFYHVCLNVLSDVEEKKEVDELVEWWNRCVVITDLSYHRKLTSLMLASRIFPTAAPATSRNIPENSGLARLKQRRAALKAQPANEA